MSDAGAIFFSLFIAGACAAGPALSQVSQPQEFELSADKQLKKNGADKLVVRAEDADHSSNGCMVWLQGVTGAKVLWQVKVPLHEEINLAKCGADADGPCVAIWSQYPFKASTVTQRFYWNGKQLIYKGLTNEDASDDAVQAYMNLAESGTRAQFKKAQSGGQLEIMYPGNYVSDETIAKLIARGHKAALIQFRKGDVQSASSRLELTFDLAVDLASNNWPVDEKAKSNLDRWINLFSNTDLALKTDDYIAALNDYAFFLQQQGKESIAIAILRQVIAKAPDRSAAYLNIADGLWATGQNDEAKKFYSDYIAKMGSSKTSAAVPRRAIERSK